MGHGPDVPTRPVPALAADPGREGCHEVEQLVPTPRPASGPREHRLLVNLDDLTPAWGVARPSEAVVAAPTDGDGAVPAVAEPPVPRVGWRTRRARRLAARRAASQATQLARAERRARHVAIATLTLHGS